MEARPRSRINPALVQAVLASPIPNKTLAQRAQFPAPADLSRVLHDRYVVASPRTVGRLHALAFHVGFAGPVFVGDPIPAVTGYTGLDGPAAPAAPDEAVTEPGR